MVGATVVAGSADVEVVVWASLAGVPGLVAAGLVVPCADVAGGTVVVAPGRLVAGAVEPGDGMVVAAVSSSLPQAVRPATSTAVVTHARPRNRRRPIRRS